MKTITLIETNGGTLHVARTPVLRDKCWYDVTSIQHVARLEDLAEEWAWNEMTGWAEWTYNQPQGVTVATMVDGVVTINPDAQLGRAAEAFLGMGPAVSCALNSNFIWWTYDRGQFFADYEIVDDEDAVGGIDTELRPDGLWCRVRYNGQHTEKFAREAIDKMVEVAGDATPIYIRDWAEVDKVIRTMLADDPAWVQHWREGSADDGFVGQLTWRKEG